ncbi:hypothetical protein [Roseateles flavus]|uniref:Cobalt-zinc-cadmium resistance protein n=1 Tax=Roseateles flavus TaxID=3149041 RepID=A0ABV0GFD0_9BURK
MRRYIVLVMLIVLPLQFCWAAAAIYCSHESATSVTHFGHHGHQHQAGSQGEAGATVKAKVGSLVLDEDCSVCHSCAASGVLPSQLSHAECFGSAPALPTTLLFESYVPSGLERPDRSIAA